MAENPSGAASPTLLLVMWAVLTVALSYLWPWDLPEVSYLKMAARVMVAAGGLLLLWAQFTLWRMGTTADHNKSTVALVTNGPYRISRNPIYLGMTLLLLGIAMANGKVWGVVLVIPFVAVLHFRTILPEENYLERTFGERFAHYRNTVRRWL
jgi:protein-S-isoprenylcysteine O-methyltransferase Ste14